jgi:transcription antitermination factor NusG
LRNGALDWFALTVRHQHERRTAGALASRGWETLVPCYRTRNQWSDRMKDVERPLFGGYVLCRFAARDRMRIEDTPGVARIVEFGGAPAPLAEEEIARIRAILASRLGLSPWPFLTAGDRVSIERGPLKGLDGLLIQVKDSYRLVVGVELLQRSIAVEVDPEMVVPRRVMTAAAAG